MVRLVSHIRDPLDDARALTQTLFQAAHLAQSNRALKLREKDSEFDRQRTTQIDAEGRAERSRANERADVQMQRSGETHVANMQEHDWRSKRRQKEEEQEEAAQEANAQLMSDAFGVGGESPGVPGVVQRRLAAVAEQVRQMDPVEGRALMQQTREWATGVITERRRGQARELLKSLATPDPDTGEAMIDEQSAAKYAQAIDGVDPDVAIEKLMEVVRTSSDRRAHAEMRQAAVARVDQAFTEAEGLSQTGARYGVSGRDPGQIAKARSMRHMLSTLPLDAKGAAELERQIYGLLFDAPKQSPQAPAPAGRGDAFDVWRRLKAEERTLDKLGELRAQEQGEAGAGATPGVPAGPQGEQPAPAAPDDRVFKAAADKAFSELPAEKQTPEMRAAVEKMTRARAEYDTFEDWLRAEDTKARWGLEEKGAMLQSLDGGARPILPLEPRK